jgi:large subunit ribosomal protein L24
MKPLVYKKARRRRHTETPVRVRIRITKGDTVQVVSGDDKGKQGKVLRVNPKSGRITIEGINIVKRHRRATQSSEGGIIEFAAPIHHSKAMLIDPKSGEPTRIRRRKDTDGTVERIAIKSGQPIPRNR